MEVREKLNREVGNYFISSITFSGIITILKGSVWITSAGLPIHLVFDLKHRSVINLWHGVPLKKIVLLENHLNWLKKLYVKVFFSRRYTAIATTSINMLETYAASFGVPDNVVKVLGQPRNDLLSFDNKAQFNNVFPNIRGRKILYAPTYREWGKLDFSHLLILISLSLNSDYKSWMQQFSFVFTLRTKHSKLKESKNLIELDLSMKISLKI